MGESASVTSVDALKAFRVSLIKFQESAFVAIAEGEGDLTNTLNWLETEQFPYWAAQIRKRHELHERAKEALRVKTIFKDSSGRIPSAVEEQKAVRVAKMRLEEAEMKLASVKKYARVLVKELQVYKGSVQRFATTVTADIPVATAQLGLMAHTLEQYAALNPSEASAPMTMPAEERSEPKRE